MRSTGLFFLLLASLVSGHSAEPADDTPRFDANNRLARPANYREWVWLSSGLGMSYGPMAMAEDPNPPFDNVFVAPAAYRAFVQSGKWPDKTMFVLELRDSVNKGSINQGGHFQGELSAVEVEVKDDRLPGKWAFFGFGKSGQLVNALPKTASCYTCHAQNAAVENTFVQFYPTLAPIAKEKGTFKQ